MSSVILPPFANGYSLCKKELLACSSLSSHLKIKKPSFSRKAGGKISKSKGRGMEFLEVRPYHFSDDSRNIDWKVTARMNSPYTKVFCEEKERDVFIAADLSYSSYIGSSYFLKSTQIAHVAATLAWSLFRNNDSIGSLVFNNNLSKLNKIKSGKSSVLALINSMVSVDSNYYKNLKDKKISSSESNYFIKAIDDVNLFASSKSTVWIITDGFNLNVNSINSILRLRRKCDVSLILVKDPLTSSELSIPYFLNLSVFNGSDIISIRGSDLTKYIANIEVNFKQSLDLLNKYNFRSILLSSGVPLSSQFMALK